MKKVFFITFYILHLAILKLYSQPKFCADSSIRIKYTHPGNPFALFTNPDTNGKNIFTGTYWNATRPVLGLIAMKTNWGDSICWAKKYYSDNNIYLGCKNGYKAPEGTLVLTGERRYFSTNTFLISRIDTNGNMLWARHFLPTTGGSIYLINPNYEPKNIFVSDDAIFISLHLGFWDIVVKLDLNGNLLWSRAFASGSPPFSPGNYMAQGLIEVNGVVYFASNTVENGSPGSNGYKVAITQLNDSDGRLIKSTIYSIVPDTFAKGLATYYLYPHKDGSFSLTGHIAISVGPNNIAPQSNTRFNVQLDATLSPLAAYYYTTNISSDNTFQFDMNSLKQSIFQYNKGISPDKYFIIFDSTQQLLRSRKFGVTTNPVSGASGINLDDKQNVHFVYSYSLNGQNITEYARLSDLAPANTVQCFGIDTASIFQHFPLTLTREPYTWPFMDSNLVNSLPVNIYSEDVVINKEVVCKQVSYCDSLKITGSSNSCFPGMDMRYSAWLNPECLKKINWQLDTAYASVVSYEADSAITLRFKQPGQFYLKAAVNNCVVVDSVLVTITPPQTQLGLTRSDSVLCPGKNIVLQVNSSFRTYQWQDGSNLPVYNVTGAGLYRITATDSCGNNFSDSIRITMADTSLSIPSQQSICLHDSASVLLPRDIYNITWQPDVSSFINGRRLVFYPMHTTSYTIRAQKTPGCDVEKTITVTAEKCPEWVRIPSAFTPNNDGLNDIFKPLVSGKLAGYNMKIFDRSGQLIFNSENPFAGWDGTYKNIPQNGGVFVYLCCYRFHGRQQEITKGTVMLIRK